MHWLNEKLQGLEDLLVRQSEYKGMNAAEVAGAEAAAKRTREVFAETVRQLVNDIAAKEGVAACFACHEGLLMQSAGEHADFERLAAEGQKLIDQGVSSLMKLDFGAFQQMVIIGQNHKVALFWMGEIGIGIVSPKNTALADALSL